MTPAEPPGEPGPEAPSPKERPRCLGRVKRSGTRCIAWVAPGSEYCASHDPALAAKRAADGAKRTPQPGDPGTDLGELAGLARRAAKVVEELEHGFVHVDEEGVTHFVPKLPAAMANARINALKFLAALAQARLQRKPGEEGAKPLSLESLA